MTVTLHSPPCGQRSALLLRPWTEEDIPDLIDVYRDLGLRRGTRAPVTSDEDARRWLGVQQRGWITGERLSFAVLEWEPAVGGHRLAANVVLKGRAAGMPSAEVGYWTAARARGRGIAAGALEALTDWAFGSFSSDGLHRLELLHQVNNHASCRVAQKCGYDLEAVVPAKPPTYPNDGHLHIRDSLARRIS